jgi:hypothetical protein
MRRVGTAAIAAAAFALAFTGQADALTKHSAPAEEIIDGVFQAVVECPSGQRAISGGYTDPSGNPSVAENRRGGARTWVVTASADFVARAYCSDDLRVSRELDTTEMGPDGSGTVSKAQCPSGSKAVSGGWTFSEPVFDTPIFRSQPKGRSWSVRGFDELGADITAFAYCLKNPPDLAIRKGSKRISGRATATASCRRGEEFLGGGWSTSPTPDWFNEDGPDTFFQEVSRVGRRTWSANAENFGTNGKIKAIAVCRR